MFLSTGLGNQPCYKVEAALCELGASFSREVMPSVGEGL